MPNPPTPEELEGWEKMLTDFERGEWTYGSRAAHLVALHHATGALLAEVKRLREENAHLWDANINAVLTIQSDCPTYLENRIAELAARTPRTTPRL